MRWRCWSRVELRLCAKGWCCAESKLQDQPCLWCGCDQYPPSRENALADQERCIPILRDLPETRRRRLCQSGAPPGNPRHVTRRRRTKTESTARAPQCPQIGTIKAPKTPLHIRRLLRTTHPTLSGTVRLAAAARLRFNASRRALLCSSAAVCKIGRLQVAMLRSGVHVVPRFCSCPSRVNNDALRCDRLDLWLTCAMCETSEGVASSPSGVCH